jgi:PAS domain S-box-containing protein
MTENSVRRGKPAIIPTGMSWPFAGYSSGIARRLLVSVLLFGSAVTLVLTATQLYLDYDREVAAIGSRLDEIERSHLGSLAESLSNRDATQLQLQLAGIRRLPDITFVEIREATTTRAPLVVTAGSQGAGSTIAREYPLTYVVQSAPQSLGVLRVEASLSRVYRDLASRSVVILLSEGAKTFLVCFFIIYIFHRLVTRHILDIAAFAENYDVARPPPPLSLQRRPADRTDELDTMVAAFSRLCTRLQTTYRDLRDTEQRFRDYAQTASDWYWETGPDHRFTAFPNSCDSLAEELAGHIGHHRHEAAADQERQPEKWRQHIATMDRHEPFRNFEYTVRRSDGRLRHIRVSGQPVFDGSGRFMGYRGTAADWTRQRETEQRLHQAQKMDAVGQLTGGVAHDFNNILTVITGTIDILARGVADRPQLAAIARMISQAARRGADLTQQLLAFARKQRLARETDINALVVDATRLLRSTLGEQIDIALVLQEDAGRAMIDPSRLSTALVNLAVNARDAMPDGGKLTIETKNIVLGEEEADANPEIRPGSYVLVAVSDTGSGIPLSIRDKVFEPFFTTKDVGKGTGLGLSMVYGFVKQSRGHVELSSDEGSGTCIKLYLPRIGNEAVTSVSLASEAPVSDAAAFDGHETVLVVEDDELVRNSVIEQLHGLGYATIAAGSGPEALAVVDSGAAFDLLFTDIVMPGGMNGRELGKEVGRRRPGVKVLYTSGYSENAVDHDGRLDPDVVLLSKPYRKAELALKIREVLGSPVTKTSQAVG